MLEATAIGLAGDTTRTLVTVDLSAGVTAEVYTLANPYRVVIDLPNVGFRLPENQAIGKRGIALALRYGFFAERAGRIVIDTSGPVRVEKAGQELTVGGTGVRLSVALVPMDAKAFGRGSGAARAEPALRPSTHDDLPPPPKTGTRPVVVIDPGHGGIDPGASGPSNLLEKTVVLDVGRRLGKVLEASGRYEVLLTRTTDVYVSLDDRLELSRRNAASLFISLHADAIEQKEMAQSVRGASVYTLSEKASNEEARLRAERENASDLLAGIDLGEPEERDELMSILVDLMKRETSEFSAEFARTVIATLGKTISLTREPERSAAFKVLKQTDSPSVLVELGYMSHAGDEKLLTSADWQNEVAASIGSAVDAYFAKRMAGTR